RVAVGQIAALDFTVVVDAEVVSGVAGRGGGRRVDGRREGEAGRGERDSGAERDDGGREGEGAGSGEHVRWMRGWGASAAPHDCETPSPLSTPARRPSGTVRGRIEYAPSGCASARDQCRQGQ